jgi:hypothetical protein
MLNEFVAVQSRQALRMKQQILLDLISNDFSQDQPAESCRAER